MKRVLYLASTMALLTSMVVAGNAFAARSHPQAAKTQTVTLCSSVPIGASSLYDDSKGIENGVVLAIHWLAPELKAAGLKVNYMPLDDGDPTTNSYSKSVELTNAGTCISTKNALGYVGPLNSGAAEVSNPALNKAHMVIISPANTNPGLTAPGNVNGFGGRVTEEPCSTSAADSCPKSDKIPYVTYYRTVTTDAIQGRTAALYVSSKFHPKSYYLVDDEFAYGVGLAGYFATEAGKLHMKQLGHSHIDTSGGTGTEISSSSVISGDIIKANPDMVFCGCDEETSGALARDLRSGVYTKVWFGGDAFDTTSWFSNSTGAGPLGSKNTWATNVGPPPSKSGKTYLRLYHKYFASFEKKPGIQGYDAPAFDAAGIILTAIMQAKKAGKLKGSIMAQRTAVVKYVHNIKFTGALGKDSFDSNGDNKNRVISVYKSDPAKGQWNFLKELAAKGSPTG